MADDAGKARFLMRFVETMSAAADGVAFSIKQHSGTHT
jgi:hypothetical protein